MITSDANRSAWFATTARGLADAARAGSLARKAALCCAVALSNSKTPTGARKVLAEVRPEQVRETALLLLDRITGESDPTKTREDNHHG